jgi:hypothetical protein
MKYEAYRELLADLSPSTRGLYWAGISVICGFVAQEVLSREQLIDYLLLLRAELSPEQRDEPYGLWLQLIVDHLEDLEKLQLERENAAKRQAD